MRTFKQLLAGSTLVAMSIAAVGAMSVLLIAIGARSLSSPEMAEFVTIWIVVNTTVVALSAAFDQQGPRIVARYDAYDGALFIHATALPAVGALLSLCLLGVFTETSSVTFSTAVYAIAVSLWSGERALRLAHGEFRQLATAAGAVFVSCSLSLLLVAEFWSVSTERMFWSAALGNLCGLVVSTVLPHRRKREQFFRPLPRDENVLAVSIALSSGSALTLSSGTVVFASSWGFSADRVVALAGIVNLVRIPFMLLNSVSGPMNVEIASSIAHGDDVRAMQIISKWLKSMLAGSFLIAVIIVAFGPPLLSMLIGPDYRFELPLAVAVVIVESLLIIAGLARFLAISTGSLRVVSGYWAFGFAIFVAIGFVSALGESRVILSAAIGTISTAVLSVIWMQKEVSHRK